jgi:hypothetical protein
MPSEIKSLSEFPHHLVLPIAQKCIDLVTGEEDTPIPSNKGDQVLLASKIATTCKVTNENRFRQIILSNFLSGFRIRWRSGLRSVLVPK